jgi:hypothetical protein
MTRVRQLKLSWTAVAGRISYASARIQSHTHSCRFSRKQRRSSPTAVSCRECAILFISLPANNGATGGSDTSCLRTSPPATSLASIEPNVTTNLATCQPWGLTVSGGQKPYTLVIIETHAATITEVTLGPEDDTLTYINRADPNWQIIGKLFANWLPM